MSMNRPPAVNALFAGHSLPRTAKALDQIREHLTRLEEVAKWASVAMELGGNTEEVRLCERMKTAHDVKRAPVIIIDDDGEA